MIRQILPSGSNPMTSTPQVIWIPFTCHTRARKTRLDIHRQFKFGTRAAYVSFN